MKRTKQHEIDAEARRIFSFVVPRQHVIREQPGDDYGVDYEIELFKNGETTGFIFKLQLKGMEDAKYINSNKQLSFNNFEIDKAEYLIEQIEIPSVIVLVDNIQKKIFWTSVQSNTQLLEAYSVAKEGKQNSLTIHFNTQNSLPDTWTDLFIEMAKSCDFLALRRTSTVTDFTYLEHVKIVEDIDAELYHLRKKIDISTSLKLNQLIYSNELQTAEDLVIQILSSSDRSIEAKFDTLMQTEQIFVRRQGNELEGMDKANFSKSRKSLKT
jgi:hypothetical protein